MKLRAVAVTAVHGHEWHTRVVTAHEARAEVVEAALESARKGDERALATLFGEVYDELHRLARHQRRRWSGNHTLDTTALVHESYLKLIAHSKLEWADMPHFLAVAAKAMRHILINYAEKQGAARRGGDLHRVDLDQVPGTESAGHDIVALGRALDRLAEIDPRRASVFECRFFLELTVEETADLLSVSCATVKRDWALAGAFLKVALET